MSKGSPEGCADNARYEKANAFDERVNERIAEGDELYPKENELCVAIRPARLNQLSK